MKRMLSMAPTASLPVVVQGLNASSFVADLKEGWGKRLLRDDDSLLRQIFTEVLRHHHPNLAGKVDAIYELATAWCEGQSEEGFAKLEQYLTELKPEESILVRACLMGAVGLILPLSRRLVGAH